MSANLTPQSWFDSSKKTWGLLAEFAVFIFGIIGTFLLPPPSWAASGGDNTLVRLGQFIIAVLAGLIFLLVLKWSRKEHVTRWAIIAIVFLVLSVASYFGYHQLLSGRTCQYDEQAVVIGNTYTQQAQEYLKDMPNATCESLLQDFAGKADDIWTRDSINSSRYVLALSYIGILPLFMVCIIAVVQAVSCASQSEKEPVAAAQPVTATGPQPGSGNPAT